MTEQSFWSGCEKYSPGLADYEACRRFRVAQINAGIKQWLAYFDKVNRPRVMIVFPNDKLPRRLVNRVIHLMIEVGGCGKHKAACRRWGTASSSFLSHEIVFEDPSFIEPRIVAHEFGHVLGRNDNDVPEGTYSVMSYKMPTNVLLRDIKMMCRLHRECRMVKRKRVK